MIGSLKQKTAVQEEIIQTTFLNIAKGYLTHTWSLKPEAQHGQLTKKMCNSKMETLDGKVVRGRYIKAKKTIGNELMPHLPINYKELGSGKGINDAFKELSLKIYKTQNLVSFMIPLRT